MVNTNLSIISLVSQSDFVVKIILLLLLFASIFSWKVIFEKVFMLISQTKKIDELDRIFHSECGLKALLQDLKATDKNFMSSILSIGIERFKLLQKQQAIDGIKEEVLRSMRTEFKRIMRICSKRVDILATIASSAPFVGLFGTVWGIMHSFQTIGIAKSATLTVVAPSIAEALLATAAGLFVAIPALVFYNYISSSTDRLAARIEDFINEFTDVLFGEL